MFKKKAISTILAMVILLSAASAMGIAGVAASGGIVYTHKTLRFTLTLPANWAGRYNVTEEANSAGFSSVLNEKAGASGWLFWIEAYDEETEIPSEYEKLANYGGKFFYCVYPGGIESAFQDDKAQEEYEKMYSDIKGIIKTFTYFPFTDVPVKEWYYKDVKSAFESGLINGSSATTFSPDKNLSYAEAVKLAATMHQWYTSGKVTLKGGSPWYKPYVDYAKANDIITGDFEWTASASRAGYMAIFAKALTPEAYVQINDIADGEIPDVPMSLNRSDAIYKLYRAGIVQGSGETHKCNPNSFIKRSEVAATITRMLDTSERIRFSISKLYPLEGTWITSMNPNDPNDTEAEAFISIRPDTEVEYYIGKRLSQFETNKYCSYSGSYSLITKAGDPSGWPPNTIIFTLKLGNYDRNYTFEEELRETLTCVYSIKMNDFDQMTLTHVDGDHIIRNAAKLELGLILG